MKLSKVLSIVAMVVMFTVAVSNVALAFDPSSITVTQPNTEKISTFSGKLIGSIQVVGTVISAIILVVLGVKYMMGSAEEKAEYKKTFVPYFVGAILIFASTSIAGIIYGLVSGL